MEATGGMTTLSSQVASLDLASHTVAQENEKVKRTNAIYGQRCLESYGKLSQATSWGKTLLASLVGQGDWYSTRCILIWNLKATKSRRVLFQLQALEQDIKDNEYGLLPTLNAQDWNTGTKQYTYQKRKERHLKKGVILQKSLRQMAADLTEHGQSTQKLKASFAMEMMGFPTNWTELPFQSGERNPSKPQEMP